MNRHDRDANSRLRFSFSLMELLAFVFVAAYLLAFLRVELPGSPIQRLELLTLLTVPDAWGEVFGQKLVPGWFGERVYLLSVAAGYLVVAAASGSLLLRWMRPRVAHTRLEQWGFALGLGLAGISLITFLLGVFGLLYQGLFLGIAAAIGVTFAVARTAVGAEASPKNSGDSPVRLVRWLWMLLPVVVLLLLGAMLPPRDFDVLEYHLQAPKEFFQLGAIRFLPHNVYANMPLGAEMHALAAMVVTQDWYAGALVGKVVMACFALLAAAAIYAFGCRFLSPAAGVVGAIAYLTTPWVLTVSAEGLIDAVLGCYTLLAIYALILWRQALDQKLPEVAVRRLILCGLMAGAAVACKYPAVLFVALPVVGFVAGSNVVPRDRRSRLYGVVVLLAAMAVPAGPWFVKNWVLAGNPTYPLLYSIFGGTTRTPAKDAQWRRAHAPPNYSPQDLGERIHRAFVSSDWLGMAMVPLALLGVAGALLRRRRDRQDQKAILVLALAGYCVLYFLLWWLLTHRIDRFLVPLLPIVAVLSGGAFAFRMTKLRKLAGVGLLLLATCYATATGLFVFGWGNLQRVFTPPPPWHRLATEPKTGDRLLLVGKAAVFDYRLPVLYNTCFDDCIFEQLIKGKDPAAAKAALRAAGITHVGVDWDELKRYRSPGNYGYSDFPTKELFDQLVAEGVLKPQPGYYPYPYSFEGFKVAE
jgi:hypothetical protein